MEPINLTPPQFEEPKLINLDEPKETPLPAAIAEKRTQDAVFSIKDNVNKDYTEMLQKFLGGKENELRQQAAASINTKANDLIRERINKQVEATGTITPGELDLITKAVRANPNTVFEQAYAKEYMQYVDKVFNYDPDLFIGDSVKEVPEAVSMSKDIGKTAVFRYKFALKQAEDANIEKDGQTWVGWTADRVKELIPFYTDVKLRGLLENVPFVMSGLGGSNLYQIRESLMNEPSDEVYAQNFNRIMTKLKKDNPGLAIHFATSMAHMSTSDIVLGNVFSIVDASMIKPGTVAAIARRGFRAMDTAMAVKDITKAVERVALTDSPKAAEAVVLDAAGAADEAAVKSVVDTTAKTFAGKPVEQRAALEAMPSALRADQAALRENVPTRISQNLINKIMDSSDSLITKLQDTMANIMRVRRIPAIEAAEEAIRAVKDRAKEMYPGLKNAVLDVSDLVYNNITNTHSVQLKIGNPQGALFANFNTAQNYFKTLHGLQDVAIERQGFGFYGRLSLPLRETDNIIRDALLATKNSTSPASWLNGWVGWLRTPEETMSIEHAINRKIATYTSSKLMQLAKESAKEINKLSNWALPGSTRKKQWYDWEKVVKQSSENWAPDVLEKTPYNKGYFYRTIGELDDGYQKLVGRLPSDREISAYFAFVRTHELDRIFREVAVQRNYQRIGGQMHMFWQPPVAPSSRKVESQWFAGVVQNELPGGNDAVMIAISKAGKERIVNAEYLHANARLRNVVQKGIDEGRYKVVRVIDPEQRPFKDYGKTYGPGEVLNFPTKVGNERVRYVISNNVNTRNFKFGELVPRRGGPHIEYDYDFYIKQPILHVQRLGNTVRHMYEGDRTIMPIGIRAMGEDVANKLDTIRELMASKRVAEAKDYAENVAKLGVEWKEIRSWFVRKKVNGVLQPPRINMTEKIQVVPRNKMTEDMSKALEEKYKGTFFDGTKRGSDARQFQVEYTGQRDAWEVFSLRDEGTRHNPLYHVEPAKTIDLIPSMNRSMSRIVQNTFLDDYKIFSIEHWLREAEPFLKTSIEDIRGAPFHTFTNPEWKGGADIEKKNALLAQHFQIRQLLGISNAADNLLQSAAQKLYDSLYKSLGPLKFDKNKLYDTAAVLENAAHGVLLAAPYLLSKIAKWPDFLRAITFHAKLGMFNPVQLIVQLQTYTTIMGVAGFKNAGAGTMAAMLHGLSRLNKKPGIIDGMDRMATKFGWKAGEFKEAMALLDRTGFGILGGEYAMLDSHLMPKMISSGAHNFLEAGTMFFKGGEKSVRHGAWYTAYREFRNVNPVKKITDQDLRTILNRADLLSVNMSRASSSALHTGVFSLPSQFLSYQLRAFELFTGKRLNWVERGRLLATYAGFYGVPTATGILGYPFGDHIRQYALENNYVVGDSYFTTLMEGIPSMLTALTVGEHYNFGDRFGTQGFEWLREAMRSDKPMWDIFGGAAYSTLSKTWENSDGFRKMMAGLIRGDGEFTPKVEDFGDLFKEISSVNNTWKMVMALNTGKWFSSRETYMGDASAGNAVFQYLTGLTPQQIADLQRTTLTIKSREEQWKYADNFFTKEFRRGLREQDNNNPEQAKQFFSRAFNVLKILDYPQERYGHTISNATKDYESLIDRLDFSMYLKDVPESQKGALLDAYRRKKSLEESKK